MPASNFANRHYTIFFISTLLLFACQKPGQPVDNAECQATLEEKIQWLNDSGINRISTEPDNVVYIRCRYVFDILANANNHILIEGKMANLESLKTQLKTYITNNGKDPGLSESPTNAFIDFTLDSATSIRRDIETAILETYCSIWDNAALAKYKKHLQQINFCELKTILKEYPIQITICQYPECESVQPIPPPPAFNFK